ncbi:MAG: GGDEF domain-containing protein [Pseudomonadota bacterium]
MSNSESVTDGSAKAKPPAPSSWATAQAAFKLITKHRTGADPLAYAVWYSYASKDNPGIIAAVDELLVEGGGISAVEMQQLHADHLKEDDQTEKKLEDISRAIHDKVAGAKSLVTDIISNTDEYVSSIDKAKGLLPEGGSPDEVKNAINGIIEQTKSSKASAQSIQVALQSKEDEITQLSSKVLQLRDNMMLDAVTELINRQKFETLLAERSSEAVTNGYSLTVLVARITNIHALNENAGTDISEFIIKAFSGVAKRVVGNRGVCARFSGPEFAIMLPRSAYADAGKIANSIIGELDTFKIVNKPSEDVIGHIQCSMGGSSLRAGLSPEELIALAAAQIREARSSGKSSVKFDLTHQSAA